MDPSGGGTARPPASECVGPGYSCRIEVTLLCTSESTPEDDEAAAAFAAAARADMCFGEPPFCDSMDGAGLRATELVCEMRWLRFGNVSATEGLRRGPQGIPGAGLVGVIMGGRLVRGLLGGNPLDSLMSI
jgi:hypothetical protein